MTAYLVLLWLAVLVTAAGLGANLAIVRGARRAGRARRALQRNGGIAREIRKDIRTAGILIFVQLLLAAGPVLALVQRAVEHPVPRQYAGVVYLIVVSGLLTTKIGLNWRDTRQAVEGEA